jgi:phospholipid/cholesterol/gamma-HCH transport system permease protein
LLRFFVDAIARLGQRAVRALATPVATWQVLTATVGGVARRLRGRSRHRRGDVLHQMYELGNRSLVFIVVTLGFLGMVMSYQACLQLTRITGDTSQVGVQLLRLVVSDFAATLTGMMLATRVGAGIAAELGSMKITEQIDALRMSGVLPIDYLVVPRVLASMAVTVGLSVIGGAAMFGAAGLTAQLSFGVNPGVFFDASAITLTHVAVGLVKAVSYGVAVPVVAAACGLAARGSSEGVGWATTSSVIGGSLLVLTLDLVWSIAVFVAFQGTL